MTILYRSVVRSLLIELNGSGVELKKNKGVKRPERKCDYQMPIVEVFA